MPKAKLDNAYEILLDYGYIEPGVSDREYWEALKKATLDFAEDGNVKYFDIVRAEEKELRDKVVPKVKKKKITGAAFKKGTSQESVENIQANNEVTSLAIREPRPDVTAKDITPEVTEEEEPKKAEVKTSPVGEGLKNILNSIAGTTESIKNVLMGQQKADSDAAKDAAKDAEKSARAGQEKKLETKLFDGVKKVGEAVVKPVQSIFEKIWGFLKKVLLADIVRRLFNWLSDDGNRKKVGSIFKFVQNFWPLLLTGFLLFGTGIGSLITGTVSAIAGFIPTLLGLIPGLVAFLASPIGLAVLGTAAVVGGGVWLHNKMKGDDNNKTEGNKTEKVKSITPTENGEASQKFSNFNKGGLVQNFNTGGSVPGKGNTDTVPAMLTPGEFVLTKEATEKYGTDTLESMNAAAATGKDETSGTGRLIGSTVGGLAGGVVGFFADSPVSPVADIALGLAGSAAGGEIGDNIERKLTGKGKGKGDSATNATQSFRNGGLVQYLNNGGQAKENKNKPTAEDFGLRKDFNYDNPEHREEFVKVISPHLKTFMEQQNKAVDENPDAYNGIKLTMDRDGKMPNFGEFIANQSEFAFNQSLGMVQSNESIPEEARGILSKKMIWIRKETLDNPNFKGDLAFDINKDIPGTAAYRILMAEKKKRGQPKVTTWREMEGEESPFSAAEIARLKNRRNMNKGGLVQHFNKGGLVQYLNNGGRVEKTIGEGGKIDTSRFLSTPTPRAEDYNSFSTKQNATLQGGQVTSGNMNQSNAEKLQQRLKLEKHLMIQKSIHGRNSPEANEIKKQILILQGIPEGAIHTDRKGNLKIKGFSSYSGKNKKGKSGGGLGRLIGGAADFLTGNLTDFDGKGGKTFGASRILAGAADALTGNRWDFDKHGKPAKVAKSKPKHTEIAPPSTSFSGRGSKPGVTAINAGGVGPTIDATNDMPLPEVPPFSATLYRSPDKIKTLGIMV